jgi:uncharacterized membrane-anchored protein
MSAMPRWSQPVPVTRCWELLGSPIVAALFLIGRRGPLRLLPFYWLTVVAIRAAGTAIGDFVSGRNMLGLPASTAAPGVLFLALLIVWKESATSERTLVAEP